MTFIEFFGSLNVLLSIVTVATSSVIVLRFADMLIPVERVGLALVAAGAAMRIAPVIGAMEGFETPLDQWASSLMMAGVMVFLLGRAFRLRRHERRNRQQVADSKAYLMARGKL